MKADLDYDAAAELLAMHLMFVTALSNIALAAYYGQEAMAAKKRGGMEKLRYIENTANEALAQTRRRPDVAA